MYSFPNDFLTNFSGNDESSVKTVQTLESVAEKVSQHAVALKLKAGSETAKQFGQVYPVLIIPSVFIIKAGVPVDIMAGEVKEEDFVSKFEKALSVPVTSPAASSSSSKSKKLGVIALSGDGQLKNHLDSAEPDDLIVVDFTASWCPPCKMIAPVFENLAYKYECQGAVFIKVDVDKCKLTAAMYGVRAMPTFIFFRAGQRLQDKDVQGADASLLESRVLELIHFKPMEPIENPYVPSTSHVQSKLEQVRAKKCQEEQDKELEDEKERRSVGKSMAKLKKAREEVEMKEALEERKKDAILEKEARARVLAQIQADREERKRRFENKLNWIPDPSESSAKKKSVTEDDVSLNPFAPSKPDSESTRIQFRFPDGHTVTQEFKSTDVLLMAKEFVQEAEPSLNRVKFSLSQTFPRKLFSDQDMDKSFLNHGLVPSTVLLVIPDSRSSLFTSPSCSSSTAVSSSQGLFRYLNVIPFYLILVPFATIWKFVTSFLPTTPPPAIPPGSARDAPSTSSSTEPSSSGSQVRNRKPAAKDGKIHRLKDAQDSEDENNTWNGNSTQQM